MDGIFYKLTFFIFSPEALVKAVFSEVPQEVRWGTCLIQFWGGLVNRRWTFYPITSRELTVAHFCRSWSLLHLPASLFLLAGDWILFVQLQRRNVAVVSMSTLPRCFPNSHSSHTVRPNQRETRHTCRQPTAPKSETRELS